MAGKWRCFESHAAGRRRARGRSKGFGVADCPMFLDCFHSPQRNCRDSKVLILTIGSFAQKCLAIVPFCPLGEFALIG